MISGEGYSLIAIIYLSTLVKGFMTGLEIVRPIFKRSVTGFRSDFFVTSKSTAALLSYLFLMLLLLLLNESQIFIILKCGSGILLLFFIPK